MGWGRMWLDILGCCEAKNWDWQMIQMISYNVNPGLMNPKRLLNWGGTIYVPSKVTIWRVPPNCHKPWFSLIRGWHYEIFFRLDMDLHGFFNGPIRWPDWVRSTFFPPREHSSGTIFWPGLWLGLRASGLSTACHYGICIHCRVLHALYGIQLITVA